jgi:DNA-directed RNA polymerase specialized sigma subunit
MLRAISEEAAILRQRIGLIRQVLGKLADRDKEILTRFYVDEQTPDQICSEMGLTETQYRLMKSRAKTRFGELGKKQLFHNGRRSRLARRTL